MKNDSKVENQVHQDLNCIEFGDERKQAVLSQAEEIFSKKTYNTEREIQHKTSFIERMKRASKRSKITFASVSCALVLLMISGLLIGLLPSWGGTPIMENVPVFVGYKAASQSIETSQVSTSKSDGATKNKSIALSAISAKQTSAVLVSAENTSKMIFTNNKDILVLEYENPLRDVILDVLINDSALGKNCVYTTSSNRYFIRNIEIVWNEEKNMFMSEVYIEVPPSLAEGERTIEIMGTNFLRDLIEGKAAISENAEKTVYYDCKLKNDVDLQGVSYILSDDFQTYTIGKSVTNNNIHAINIPASFKEQPVVQISNFAFENNTNIESIELSENIENIDLNFFSNCLNLKNVYINENNPNYASIGGVLYNKQIETLIYYPIGKADNSFTILDSVTLIKTNAFGGGILKNLVIPSTVETIEKGAINKNMQIKTLSLPFIGESRETNQFIGFIFGAQSYSTNELFVPLSLDKVTVNGGDLDVGAFYKCKGVSEIILPNNLKIIPDFSFSYTNIISINIPESTTYIGKNAFAYCENLKKINSTDNGEFIFNENIEFLGAGMIAGCSHLEKLTIPFLGNDSVFNGLNGNIGYLGNLFDSFYAPNNYFLDNSKYMVVYQTQMYYPNGGRSVKEYFIPRAFYELKVSNASKINDYALSGFTNLSKIYLNRYTTVGKMAFDHYTSSQTIYYKYSTADWDADWNFNSNVNIVAYF